MEKTSLSDLASLKEFIGLVLAGLSAAVLGAGRSHMKVRDRLQNTEVRLDVMEDRTEKLEETTKATHESVVRLEVGVLGIEDDMKNSIRRQEKMHKTINSIEQMFKIRTDDGPDSGSSS